MTIVKRLLTGELYEASYPDDYNEYKAIADCVADRVGEKCLYYFRHVIPTNKKWWQFWKRKYARTGNIWEPSDESSFEVVEL